MRFFLTLVILICSANGLSHAGEAAQTDWSDGGGLNGPVVGWNESFYEASGTSWFSPPGILAISSRAQSTPVKHIIDDEYTGAFTIFATDIDGDGDSDLLGTCESGNRLILWINEGGDPVGWTRQTIESYWPGGGCARAGDIDGDGFTDIISASPGSGQIAWWRNDGGDPIGWEKKSVTYGFPQAWCVEIGDLDQDGRFDIVSAAWDLGDIRWWRNGGGDPLEWTSQTIDPAFPGAHFVKLGDLDGDGDPDLVGAAAEADAIVWYRNDGGDPIDWHKDTIRSGFNGARCVSISDIDDDGALDIVGAAWNHEITWWRNNGGDPLEWREQVIDGNFGGAHSVHTEDINGDGFVDVIGAAYNDFDITWWENSGTYPVNWTEHIVTGNSIHAATVHAADIDGDGDNDILGTSSYYGEFSWWEVTEFLTDGELTSSILDLGAAPGWAQIDWNSVEPANTTMEIQVRSGSDPESLGDWSVPIIAPGYLADPPERYFQYRIGLHSGDPDRSPLLQEIRLLWEYAASTPDQQDDRSFRFVVPSPALRSDSIRLRLIKPGRVNLTVFDLSGRSVAEPIDACLSSSDYHVPINRLSPGIYYCRLIIGDQRITKQLTVIR